MPMDIIATKQNPRSEIDGTHRRTPRTMGLLLTKRIANNEIPVGYRSGSGNLNRGISGIAA